MSAAFISTSINGLTALAIEGCVFGAGQLLNLDSMVK
jgi:hypothetical protein